MFKGARTEGELRPVDGLCLDTLSSNGEEFPKSLYAQIDEHDIRYEQYAQRAILSLEHETGPVLYAPDDETTGFPHFRPSPEICNPVLSPVSTDGLCRAMSVEINGYVDWFGQWWEYSDADAFLLNSGHSHSWRDTSGLSPILVTVEHLERSLELNGLLDGFTSLDLGIARWRRSKRATIIEDRLVELRIALESVLLPDDRGVVGEKRHRLATRGVWLLGETPEQRKS